MSLPITGYFGGSIDVPGDVIVGGDLNVTGAINVTGGIVITGPIDAVSVGTNVLRDNAAVVDTAIIMQSNAGLNDYFDIQRLQGARADFLSASTLNANLDISGNGTGFVDCSDRLDVDGPLNVYGSSQVAADELISFTLNNDLRLNANGTGNIQITDLKSVVPQTDDTSDFGTALLAFKDMFLNQLRINQKADYAQATNITTAVAITNAESAFQITTQAAGAASAATETFSVTNAAVLLGSYIFCQVVSYSGTPFTNGVPHIEIGNVLAGSFDVSVRNYGGSALSGTFILRFIVV